MLPVPPSEVMPDEMKLNSEQEGAESLMGSSPPASSLSVSLSGCSSDGSLRLQSLERQHSLRDSGTDMSSCSESAHKMFSAAEYLCMHRDALDERARVGAGARKMKGLYR